MLTNIPMPQCDQTMESLAALTALFNGLKGAKAWAKSLFGVTDLRSIDTTYHYGSKRLFEALGGAGYPSCSDFLDNHSLIGLYKPFAPPKLYERARNKLIDDNVHGIASLLGTNGLSPFADQTRYCRECAISEFRSLGYAYAHRTHQVSAVTTCPLHSVKLVTLSERYNGITSRWGLLMPNIAVTSLSELDFVPISQLECRPEIRLDVWVYAAINARLTTTSTAVRQRLIRERLDSLSREPLVSGVYESRLEKIIAGVYPDTFQLALGLDVRDGVTRHWPSKLMRGEHFADHAIPNLLVLAALFDAPDDFNKAAARLDERYSTTKKVTSRPGMPRIDWRLTIIKDILRMPRLEDVASKYGMHVDTVRAYLQRNPPLAERRRKALAAMALKQCRATLETMLESNPLLTRHLFRRSHFTMYDRLMKMDRIWFDHKLPPGGHPIQTVEDVINQVRGSGEDARLAQRLRDEADTIRAGRIPVQITRSLLITKIDDFPPNRLLRNAYAETERTLSELSESSHQYEARVIDQLALLAARGDIAAVKTWAADVISQFSHRADIVAKVVDMLLYQTMRSAIATASVFENHPSMQEEATNT